MAGIVGSPSAAWADEARAQAATTVQQSRTNKCFNMVRELGELRLVAALLNRAHDSLTGSERVEGTCDGAELHAGSSFGARPVRSARCRTCMATQGHALPRAQPRCDLAAGGYCQHGNLPRERRAPHSNVRLLASSGREDRQAVNRLVPLPPQPLVGTLTAPVQAILFRCSSVDARVPRERSSPAIRRSTTHLGLPQTSAKLPLADSWNWPRAAGPLSDLRRTNVGYRQEPTLSAVKPSDCNQSEAEPARRR